MTGTRWALTSLGLSALGWLTCGVGGVGLPWTLANGGHLPNAAAQAVYGPPVLAGLTFVLGGAGLVAGVFARRLERGALTTAAVVVGALTSLAGLLCGGLTAAWLVFLSSNNLRF